MKVLLVGSGGREHALAWRLSQDPGLDELHAAPGNPGIAKLGICHPAHPQDGESLLALCRSLEIDLAVIGPEGPLVAGVADELRHGGVAVFGPGRGAAQIEGSKAFAKDVMQAAGVPTAEALPVARVPCVIKADGLAAGKGVYICRTGTELEDGLRNATGFGGSVVIEELLEGREASLFAICDGARALPLAPAQDYSRASDGDEGPNTGGMGSFSPVPGLGPEQVDELVETVHEPVLRELAARGTPFVGLLYAGLMLTDSGPRVLEFNCRFGDPETQAILPRLEGDLLGALAAAARGKLGDAELSARPEAAVVISITGPDYPARSDYAGVPIEGVEDAEESGALVFHAGTALHGGRLVTSGGRILSVTALGETLAEARGRAYDAVARISFDGARYRTDIAAIEEQRVG